jgi:hypothetical protein
MSQSETSLFPSQPLDQVRPGMTVVESNGRRLGSVSRVQEGDARAVTTAGNEAEDAVVVPVPPELGVADSITMMGTSPVQDRDAALRDLPQTLREHMQRTGYLELDDAGAEAVDRFIAGDWISSVSGDQVVVRRPSA